MRPVLIDIRKATTVPTKKQIVHQNRTDWKRVARFSYQDSISIFKPINGSGIFETDAQFCKWIKDNLGPGRYLVFAWKKGHKGMWNFMKAEIGEDFYKRLPRTKSQEQIEIERNIRERKRLKRQFEDSDEDEREDLSKEISYLEQDHGDLDDIEKTRSRFHGPMGYLKSKKPIYSVQEYEDYGESSNKDNSEVKQMSAI